MRVRFYGRTLGAIGIFQWLEAEVGATDLEVARLELQDKYQDVQRLHEATISCDAQCPGWFWATSNGTDQDLHIERCDICNRLESDTEAEKFAWIEINKKSAVIEMLKTYSKEERLTVAWMLLGKKRFRS